MTTFRFRGLFSGIEPAMWIAKTPRMVAFRDRIERSLRGGTPRSRRQRAQLLMERLLVAVLDDVGTHYVEGLGRHIDEVMRIRTELNTRYNAVLGLAPGTRVLPQDLTPASFERLFSELDSHLVALEAGSPRQHLEGSAPHEILVPHANEVADDIQRGMRPDLEGPRERLGPEPDLPLDRDPGLDVDRAGRGEQDRAARAAWRDRKRVLPEDPAARAHVQQQAQAALNLPPDWQIGLQRIGPYSEALRAQIERLEALDPHFLANGYEITIKAPDGRVFRPDGIEMVSTNPRRFRFLEHKEPLTPMGESSFGQEGGALGQPLHSRQRDRGGASKLRESLIDDAHLARDLADRGCEGWSYSTGQRWLDDQIAAEIAEIRRTNPSLGQYLHPPGSTGVR